MTDFIPSDDSRIADALRFYLERAAWSPSDAEKAEFERLLQAFRARAKTKEAGRRMFMAATGNMKIDRS